MTPGQKVIQQIREAYRIMASGEYCIHGCSSLKKEGCRSFSENAPIDKNGICSKCKKKRCGFLTEDERIIKSIIE